VGLRPPVSAPFADRRAERATVTIHRRFGTHPDVPDARDREYLPKLRVRLPRAVDLRPGMPPVYNQHTLNACSAHAIGALMWYDEINEVGPAARAPSRLFLYYNERVREREVHHNAPVSLRDGYRSVATRGVCPEHLWPYRVGKFAVQPPRHCYHAAKSVRAVEYFRLPRDLRRMRACLAEGRPFTLGVSIHHSFMAPKVKRTGEVPIPPRGDKVLGGHAMLVVGYHDRSKRFIVRNSWGAGWGLDGYCMMPYAFVMDPTYAWDFWTCWRVGSR
jgi:C1A family cysteine protease